MSDEAEPKQDNLILNDLVRGLEKSVRHAHEESLDSVTQNILEKKFLYEEIEKITVDLFTECISQIDYNSLSPEEFLSAFEKTLINDDANDKGSFSKAKQITQDVYQTSLLFTYNALRIIFSEFSKSSEKNFIEINDKRFDFGLKDENSDLYSEFLKNVYSFKEQYNAIKGYKALSSDSENDPVQMSSTHKTVNYLGKKYTESMSRLNTLIGEKETLQNQYNEKSKEVDFLKQKNKEKEDLLKKERESLSTLNKESSEYKSLYEGQLEKTKTLETKKSELENTIDELTRKLKAAEETNHKYETDYVPRQELNQVEESAKNSDNEVNKYKSEVEELTKKNKFLKENYDSVLSNTTQLISDEVERTKEQYEKKVSKLSSEISTLNKELNTTQEHKKGLISRYNCEIRGLDEKIKSLAADARLVKPMKEKNQRLEQELGDINQRNVNLLKELSQYKQKDHSASSLLQKEDEIKSVLGSILSKNYDIGVTTFFIDDLISYLNESKDYINLALRFAASEDLDKSKGVNVLGIFKSFGAKSTPTNEKFNTPAEIFEHLAQNLHSYKRLILSKDKIIQDFSNKNEDLSGQVSRVSEKLDSANQSIISQKKIIATYAGAMQHFDSLKDVGIQLFGNKYNRENYIPDLVKDYNSFIEEFKEVYNILTDLLNYTYLGIEGKKGHYTKPFPQEGAFPDFKNRLIAFDKDYDTFTDTYDKYINFMKKTKAELKEYKKKYG